MDTPTPKPKTTKIVAADGHTYSKSATANATTAPTNTATVEQAVPSKGVLNSLQLDFVTIVHYEWGLSGTFDIDYLTNTYGYTKAEIQDFLNNSAVVKAIEERGIPVGKIKQVPQKEVTRSKLTPIQLIVANTMLDLADTRSVKKKLQDLGVNTATYQMWLRDADFSNYMKERAEGLIGDVQHEAHLSLIDKIQAGDLNAIKYYNEMTGRYIQQTTANQGSTGSHDLEMMIVRIIEIIIDEVDDPQVASRISDRLKGLVTGAQVAGMLATPEPTITQPELAKPRTITPEVKELMNRGLGYDS